MLIKRELGALAIAYIRDVLDYDNYLCYCINSCLGSTGANLEIFSYLPEEFHWDEITDFKNGGVFSATFDYLEKYLLAQYGQFTNAAIIFDDVMASPSDKFLKELETSCFAINGDVYQFVNKLTLEEETLSKIIGATSVSWHFLCVIIETEKLLSKDEFINIFDCNYICQSLKEFVIGAFDGEGFIHCVIKEQCIQDSSGG